MITGIIVGICVMLILFFWNSYEHSWVAFVSLLVIVFVGIKACNDSPTYQASLKEMKAEAAREAQPHVIREADGCKVYAFKSGDRYHYFTKCGLTTSTESSYNVSCGKSCSKTEVETIVTENKNEKR